MTQRVSKVFPLKNWGDTAIEKEGRWRAVFAAAGASQIATTRLCAFTAPKNSRTTKTNKKPECQIQIRASRGRDWVDWKSYRRRCSWPSWGCRSASSASWPSPRCWCSPRLLRCCHSSRASDGAKLVCVRLRIEQLQLFTASSSPSPTLSYHSSSTKNSLEIAWKSTDVRGFVGRATSGRRGCQPPPPSPGQTLPCVLLQARPHSPELSAQAQSRPAPAHKPHLISSLFTSHRG